MGQQKPNHLARYAEITTIHGIKDLVFSKNRVLRLAWSLCLMATLGLLCWYTYETVKYYLSGPTMMRVSTVQSETYPPIHVCSSDLLDYNQITSPNFTFKEIKAIRNLLALNMYFNRPYADSTCEESNANIINSNLYFNAGDCYRLNMTIIEDIMKHYNRSWVQDMTRLSWNVSLEGQGDTATIRKRFLLTDNMLYCQSISNVDRKEDLGIKYPTPLLKDTYIGVGEDLFGERVVPDYLFCKSFSVEILEIKKKILLNRPGFKCTHDYDSVQACVYDCKQERNVCKCNGTASAAAYNISEGFWLLDILKECNESQFNSSCSQSYDDCRAQCKPCVTWTNQFTMNKECDLYTIENWDLPVSLRVTKVPIMEVSEQAYSYTASSMMGYIGGLLGLFCGASVLSFVQAFLFWWGDECHIRKNKVEDAVAEDAVEQDNIQNWVEQATLHIPHCKLCSTVTSKNIQLQKSDEAQTSQRDTNRLVNYANNTTIHGIKDFLFVKNKLLKLVWGLFLLAVVNLMCEEIYRTIMNYIRSPTATARFVDLDTYPTIHVCSDAWYIDTQARSYGFTEEDLAFISLAFQAPSMLWDKMKMKIKSIEGSNTAFEEQRKSVQLKMKQHNLTTVRDMLNLITWNISIQGQKDVTRNVSVVKRWRGRVLETTKNTYVCHSVSNASAQHDLSIKLPKEKGLDEFIVVGEDPFAERIKNGHLLQWYSIPTWVYRYIKLKIWEINKRSLLGKDTTCNKAYNSFGVCRQDCSYKKDLCNCNGTIKNASYENNEDFFLLASRHDCRDDAGCNQDYDRCVEMCIPCTTWDYQVTTIPYLDRDYKTGNSPLNIVMVPQMKISQEDYIFPVRSLLSNIGGLLGLFCGASVLSLVQLLLFWWDDGCLLSKTKGNKMNDTKDHINTWLQQVAQGIPQCELCKELTSTRTQNKQSGEVKTSQQKSNRLANYAKNTSIHGIKDLVFCKNKLVKFAWGLLLIMVFNLMCEEIYRTVGDYALYPTNFDESTILLDKYPPVHFCIPFGKAIDTSRAVVKSYGFDDDEIYRIENIFQGVWPNISDTKSASIKRKMEEHNLSTVLDMLNIVTVNVSLDGDSKLPDDPAPEKRWRREVNNALLENYVCYTFSNYTVSDKGLIIKLPPSSFLQTFVVIGEDPFGLRQGFYQDTGDFNIQVSIKEINQLSLLNNTGTCSHEYTSSGVCIRDCVSKESACNSSYPTRLPSYENNELFWILDDPTDYDNITCHHNREDCTAKCKQIPCTTWTYQTSAFISLDWNKAYRFFKLNIINPIMTVSQEVYTYPASSLLANIGGLVSLFCGGSVLSIVQVILFWWGDGCCRREGKERKEETAVIPEDDLHKWIQHAALHRT